MKFNEKYLYIFMFSVILLQSTIAIINIFTTDYASINDSQINDDNDVSNFVSHLAADSDVDDEQGNESISFYMESKMPYARIWIKNDSYHDYNVTVSKGTPNGTELYSFYTPSRSFGSIIKTFTKGTYFVNITSESGYPLKGRVIVRVATDIGSLPN